MQNAYILRVFNLHVKKFHNLIRRFNNNKGPKFQTTVYKTRIYLSIFWIKQRFCHPKMADFWPGRKAWKD